MVWAIVLEADQMGGCLGICLCLPIEYHDLGVSNQTTGGGNR